MRKIVKEAERCPTCNKVTKWEETAVFCDFCQTQIPKEEYALKMDLFFPNDFSELDYTRDIELCSFACLKKWLEQNKDLLKTTWFVNLPHLIFNENHTGETHCDSGENFLKVFIGDE